MTPRGNPRQKWVSLRNARQANGRQKLVKLEREWARGDYDPWTDRIRREGTTANRSARAVPRGPAPERVCAVDGGHVRSRAPAPRGRARSGLPPLRRGGEAHPALPRAAQLGSRTPTPTSHRSQVARRRRRATAIASGSSSRGALNEKLITTNPAPAPSKGKKGRRRDLPEFLSLSRSTRAS